MAKFIGSKCKLMRREGTDLYLKSGKKVWTYAENEYVGIGIRFTKSPSGARIEGINPDFGPSNISPGDIILGAHTPGSSFSFISFKE